MFKKGAGGEAKVNKRKSREIRCVGESASKMVRSLLLPSKKSPDVQLDPIEVSYLLIDYLNSNRCKDVGDVLLNKEELFQWVSDTAEAGTRLTADQARPIDHACVQLIVMRINELFDAYNQDLHVFNFSLSIDVKSTAHLMALHRLFKVYLERETNELNSQIDGWLDKLALKKDYFINLVSPYASTDGRDEQSAKQYVLAFEDVLKALVEAKAKVCRLFIS